MAIEEELRITRNVKRIMDIIDEYACCPDEISLLKTACEVEMIALGIEFCPFEKEKLCSETHCRNCEIWIKQSGLCRSC